MGVLQPKLARNSMEENPYTLGTSVDYFLKNTKLNFLQVEKIRMKRKYKNDWSYSICNSFFFILLGFVGISLPVGNLIIQELIPDINQTEYGLVIEGIVNGLVYGIIVWFIFSLIKNLYEKNRDKKHVLFEVDQKSKQQKAPIISPRSLMNIEEIQGIGATYGKKLRDQGIMTTEALYTYASLPESRKELSEKTEISEKLILDWVSISDFIRIKGFKQEYYNLLKETGVNNPSELAKKDSRTLHEKLLKINLEKEIVPKLPSIIQIEDWIEKAGILPKDVKYK
jgi:predicted flap endonuclease-1-like 5' DNA nuclease